MINFTQQLKIEIFYKKGHFLDEENIIINSEMIEENKLRLFQSEIHLFSLNLVLQYFIQFDQEYQLCIFIILNSIMSKSSDIQASLSFITTKCNQISQNPSQINNLNGILEKYLQIGISPSDAENFELKLRSFKEICHLVSGLINKASLTKNSTLSTFLQKKTKVLVQIFVGNDLISILVNENEFQIVAETVSQIIVLLNEANHSIFAQKFTSKIILQQQESPKPLNSKILASLYQGFTKAPSLQRLLQELNNKLLKLSTQNQKGLESLCIFFINLPPFELIQIPTAKASSNKQKSFEDQLEQEKPKTQFKKLFQTTFLKLLPLIEPHKDIAITLYRKLDSRVLSKMNNPLILANYFLDKFKQEPQIQIQVLSCLFILVAKYGLQFENFYPQLQQLIKQKKDGKSVYQMKNSKRFFKLVESALRSSKVPFKTIETMTKTIMSQIIEEESEFAFWALPFFFNLTKKHRKLLDIFKDIPQISLLARHYNPKIRSLVNELKKDLNKSEYLDIQKFSKIDCKKITQKKVEELCSKLRGQNEAEFKIPGLFEDL